MAKIPTITLSHYQQVRHSPSAATLVDLYRVAKVTDSVDYTPGDILEKPAVKDLCENSSFKVTIFSDNPR
jgi:hypothetical protein